MLNLWLCNIDEVPQGIDPIDAFYINQYTRVINARNLFNLNSGDIALFGQSLDMAFVNYCTKITNGEIHTFPDGCCEGKVDFVDAISSNAEFIAKLRRQYDLSKFTLQPFVQSSKAYMLSQLLGTKWSGASPELIDANFITKANSKRFTKELAASISVKTAPYSVASNASELLNNIGVFGLEYGQLFLKKDGMCGGMGNISGTAAELKKILPSWYHTGDVLLEPFLPVSSTLGSFVNVLPERVEFVGVDEQFFCGYEWGGFKYPSQNERIVNEIKSLSIKVSEGLRSLGLYGPVNLDWLVLGDDRAAIGYKSGDVVLGECNFRYTGVHPAIRFSQQYYGNDSSKIRIVSHAQYPIGKRYNTFTALYDKLLSCNYLGRSILLSGATPPGPGILITRPPYKGACGISFFAYEQKELDECAKLVADSVS